MKKTAAAAPGCLLIHDLTAAQKQMEGLRRALEARGYPAAVPDLSGPVPPGSHENTDDWQRWLAKAQQAYVDLRRLCEKVVVLGVGYGGAVATILAEQYPVDGLVVIGSVLRMRRGSDALRRRLPFLTLPGGNSVRCGDANRLVRLSEKNLFSIVCDVLVLQTPADELCSPAGGRALLGGVRSEDRRSVELAGASIGGACRTHPEQILDAVTQFLHEVGRNGNFSSEI